MARSVDRRSEYWFDPTASEALARADRRLTNPRPSAYLASPADVKRFQGYTFEPDRLITNKEIQRLRWYLRNTSK